MNLAIYIYDDAEVLDFSGPFEVFSTANRFLTSEHKFNIFFIAQSSPVMARGGFSINPHYSLKNHPPIDVLLVVGGIHTEQVRNKKVVDWVARIANDVEILASVCTGAFILAEAKLLNGLQVTTHWEDVEALRSSYPDIQVIDNQRWVEQGKFITSGGISAGIDMSLHIVARLKDQQLAAKTAKQMEYDWQSSP